MLFFDTSFDSVNRCIMWTVRKSDDRYIKIAIEFNWQCNVRMVVHRGKVGPFSNFHLVQSVDVNDLRYIVCSRAKLSDANSKPMEFS